MCCQEWSGPRLYRLLLRYSPREWRLKAAWEYQSTGSETRELIAWEWWAAAAVIAFRAAGGRALESVVLTADQRERRKNDMSTLRPHIPDQRINTKHAPSTPRNRLTSLLCTRIRRSTISGGTKKYYYYNVIHTAAYHHHEICIHHNQPHWIRYHILSHTPIHEPLLYKFNISIPWPANAPLFHAPDEFNHHTVYNYQRQRGHSQISSLESLYNAHCHKNTESLHPPAGICNLASAIFARQES